MNDNFKALISLCQILDVDPELIKLASSIGRLEFKKLLANFAGKTIRFPSFEELKSIDDKSSRILENLSKEVSTANEKGREELRSIFKICKHFKDCSKDDLYKITWTEAFMKEFCSSYFKEDHAHEDYSNLSGEQMLELHKLKIKEGKIFKQILTTISELMIKKDP